MELGYRLDSRSYGITTFAEYVKNGLAGLTLADINRVVRENLQAKNVKIVMVAKDAAPLKEALISDAPSPIQYNAAKPRELLEEDEVIANYPLKIPRDAVRIIPGGEVFR